ncbi:MAG TPA: N-acetyl-gamma-glutamyl-phosphate reductase [Rectinemataceae bacterium]|nr:N-acetyl-gamma-glutamyl-phosphate reductase [Rectinemataceae bacterium]
MITVAVIGATGYAGAELARLLLGHPSVGRLVLASSSAEGETMASVYPNLLGGLGGSGLPELRFVSPEAATEAADVVFSSLPHGIAEEHAARTRPRGALLIDLSADFRFGNDEATFREVYGKPYRFPELHAESVYGLPELNRALIAKAKVIGNPGCYPTSASLGLYPGLARAVFKTEGIIIDAKSGVTGAGKEPTKTTHYPEAADSIAPYKIGEHRHGPEIERNLAAMAGRPVEAIFTPHLAPMGRGIVSTIYAPLAEPIEASTLRELYASFYAGEPFVRVLPLGSVATNRNVRLSNYCDISLHLARGGRTAIVVSAIDNMVKGAAGQAIQNMNIALGLDERLGISMLPPAF